jgi:hypothetical protein
MTKNTIILEGIKAKETATKKEANKPLIAPEKALVSSVGGKGITLTVI